MEKRGRESEVLSMMMSGVSAIRVNKEERPRPFDKSDEEVDEVDLLGGTSGGAVLCG